MMNAEYITSAEADATIARWAHRGTNVTYVEEVGDLVIFVQRPGRIELIRPGVPVHRSESGDCTTLFAGRFGEVVLLEGEGYETLCLRRPAGAGWLEVLLVADSDGTLTADTILLLAQVARSVRPPVE